jgi:hypothetical protein
MTSSANDTAPNGNVPVRRPAGAVVVGGVVAICLMLTAAVLFATGEAAEQRLALLIGVLSPTLLILVGTLRADTAAARLNGNFDERIRTIVHQAIAARRNGDPPPESVPVVPATAIEMEHK